MSFTGPSGIRQSVDVTAETPYEAAVLGLSMLRKQDWVEPIAPGTQIEVRVSEPDTAHTVSVPADSTWV